MSTLLNNPPKPKCPECGVELVLVNNELPDECAACHFVIDGFDAFLRWFKMAKKLTTEEVPPPPAPKKRRSILGNLGRR